MTICPDEQIQEEQTQTILIDNSLALSVPVYLGSETSGPLEKTVSFYSLISFSGMAKTPLSVSKFVSGSFAKLDHVLAVLAGESGDVLHVWIMIKDWTPHARKQVYEIQKTIMRQLEGLHFDFYVIDLPEGTTPEEMVSDIPIEFKRA
jgi:hypothetical protein